MIATTATRVTDNTAEGTNRRIRREMQERIAACVEQGPEAIGRRLDELDKEWDVERTIEALASSFTLTGLILGLTVNRRYLLFPVAVAGFLLQHALQGWCPPMPVLRHLGFRTAEEIAQERYALKSLRGDFCEVPTASEFYVRASADEAVQAAVR